MLPASESAVPDRASDARSKLGEQDSNVASKVLSQDASKEALLTCLHNLPLLTSDGLSAVIEQALLLQKTAANASNEHEQHHMTYAEWLEWFQGSL